MTQNLVPAGMSSLAKSPLPPSGLAFTSIGTRNGMIASRELVSRTWLIRHGQFDPAL